MKVVKAGQLIFTRVEAAFSPHDKAGFQTVYYSESLSPEMIVSIEKKIQSYQPESRDQKRYQFFELNSDFFVLTHSIVIEADPEISDHAARKGVFLCHCLIFSRVDFAYIYNNPYQIFDNYQFVQSANEMVNRYGKATKFAPVEDIEILPDCVSTLSNWDVVELRKIMFLALQYIEEKISRDKKIVLLGKEDNINELLKKFFFLLPQEDRVLFTFDTYVGDNLSNADAFLLVGANRIQYGTTHYQIDAIQRTMNIRMPSDLKHQNLYWNWLFSSSAHSTFDSIAKVAPTVQQICKSFYQRVKINIEDLDTIGCAEFCTLNYSIVEKQLSKSLTKVLGKEIADPLLAYVLEMQDKAMLVNMFLHDVIDPKDLCNVLTQYIIFRKPRWDKKNWKIIGNIALKNYDIVLEYLSLVFKTSSDFAEINQALNRMKNDDFLKILPLLLNPIEPAKFISSKHVLTVIEKIDVNFLNDNQLYNLIRALAIINQTNFLKDMKYRIEKVDDKLLFRIKKFMDKNRRCFTNEFCDQVDKVVDKRWRKMSFIERAFLRLHGC